MGQWPEGQTTLPDELIYDSGHCMIIAGYDDMDTPQDCTDDQYLIYDPWPLSGSPYWKPGVQVLDLVDVEIAQRCGVAIHLAQTLTAVAESPAAIIQPDRVWLNVFVATICQKRVEVTVPVYVCQSHGSGYRFTKDEPTC